MQLFAAAYAPQGKPAKVAITVFMPKLIVIMTEVLKAGELARQALPS